MSLERASAQSTEHRLWIRYSFRLRKLKEGTRGIRSERGRACWQIARHFSDNLAS